MKLYLSTNLYCHQIIIANWVGKILNTNGIHSRFFLETTKFAQLFCCI